MILFGLAGLAKATQVAAAAASILLARRRAEHVPAAVALVVLALVGVLRGPLRDQIEAAPSLPLIYADGAAELATYATIAGLAVAVAVRAEHRRRAVFGAVAVWACSSFGLGAAYPSPLVTGPGLHRVYFAADMAGLFVSAIALVGWMQRGIAAKRSPESAPMIALGLVALDGAILLAPFSPWRGDLFGSDFGGVQVICVLFFAVGTIAQVILWKFSRPPS